MEIIFTDLKFARPLIPLNKDRVDVIFIHHPAWRKVSVEEIHNDHLKRDNGTWKGIGYNEYIRKDGKVYIGRGDYIGAHAEGYNSRSYGICLEGNYDLEPAPSDDLLKIVAERTLAAQKRFPNAKNVLPHSARYNTNCPGKNFPMGKLYDEINNLLKIKNEMTNIDDAIKMFAELGIMNSPTFWKKSLPYYKHLDELLLNFGNYINRKE